MHDLLHNEFFQTTHCEIFQLLVGMIVDVFLLI